MKQPLFIVTLFLSLIANVGSGYHEGVEVDFPGGNGVSFSGVAYKSPTDPNGEFPELALGTTFDLFVTTPDDISVIDFGLLPPTGGTVFQDTTSLNPYGQRLATDINPPPTGAIQIKPWLAADSFVTTPGLTSCAQRSYVDVCSDFSSPTGNVHRSHFDSTDQGPQSEFLFARITLIADEKFTDPFYGPHTEFFGFVQVANQPVPIVEQFSFSLHGIVPEPNPLSMLGFGLVVLLGVRKRKR